MQTDNTILPHNDHNTLAYRHGVPDVLEQIQSASSAEEAPNDWPQAIHPAQANNIPEPYPVDCLGSIMAGCVKTISDIQMVPIEIAAQCALAFAATVNQMTHNVQVGSMVYPLSLFFITVAESGDGKSTTDKALRQPILDYQKQATLDCVEAMNSHAAKVKRWKLETATIENSAKPKNNKQPKWTPDQMTQALIELGPCPLGPREPCITCNDITTERLYGFLHDRMPAALLGGDEGGAFFGGYSMSAEKRRATISFLSKLYDGSPIDRERVGQPGDAAISPSMQDCRLSTHWLIQPSMAADTLRDNLLQTQGFLPRCLMAWPSVDYGNRLGRPFMPTNQPEVEHYRQRLARTLQQIIPSERGQPLELETLELDPEAEAFALEAYQTFEKKQAPGQGFDESHTRPFARRGMEHTVRLAGNIALIQNEPSGRVTLKQLQGAFQIVRWHLTEWTRISACLSVPQDHQDAEKIIDWITRKGKNKFSLNNLRRTGPNALRQGDAYAEPMKVLERCHIIRSLTSNKTDRAIVDGVSVAEGWQVNPAVLSDDWRY